MKIQVFNNWNVLKRERYASFWNQELDAAFYEPNANAAPRTYRDLFDEEILNSRFFFPEASHWAVDDSGTKPAPLACLVAASAPTDDSRSDAALFGPFFAAEVADAEKGKIARALIEAAEQKLLERGFSRVYAGGAPPRAADEADEPIGSPLLNGVYGLGSPVGFFDADATRDFFLDAGYQEEPRRTSSWRRAAVERNFPNARTRTIEGIDGDAAASAWSYDAAAVATDGQKFLRLVIPRLRVASEYRSSCLEEAIETLVAQVVADANERTAPGTRIGEILVVAPDDGVADEVWEYLYFEKGRRATPLVKTL